MIAFVHLNGIAYLGAANTCGYGCRIHQRISLWILRFTATSSAYDICQGHAAPPRPVFLNLRDAKEKKGALVNVRCEVMDLEPPQGVDHTRSIKFQVPSIASHCERQNLRSWICAHRHAHVGKLTCV